MKKVIITDSLIIACILVIMGCAVILAEDSIWRQGGFILGSALCVICAADILRAGGKDRKMQILPEARQRRISAVVLLDEEGRGIKSWDLDGKTALLIGRGRRDEPADIDLSQTEFGALVEEEHAVLNYACGCWFIEDLDSENGITIKKRRDGEAYQLAKGHPLKLALGDILTIACTSLEIR